MRSLKVLSFIIESIGSLVILTLVFLLLGTMRGEIKERVVADQLNELTTIEYTIKTYLEQHREHFAKLIAVGVSPLSMAFLDDFADIYYTDQHGVITTILRQEPGSRIFTGYNLSTSQVGALLTKTGGGEILQSSMIRSAEHDSVSVYVIAPQGSGFLIGRIDLREITERLRELAAEQQSILIIASPQGYIISSTDTVLPFQVLPQELAEVDTGTEYLTLRTSSASLGNDLVMLTPKSYAFRMLLALDKFFWIFGIAVVLIAALKASAQQMYFIDPLRRFLLLLKDWRLSSQAMTSAAPVLKTEEIQALYRTFVEKSAEIEETFTELHQAKEGANALRQQIEFILGATHTGLNIVDSDYNLEYVDTAWASLYGDYRGKKCHDYYAGQNEPCSTCGIEQALASNGVVVTEGCLIKENNRPVQISSIPITDADGRRLVAQVYVDITERKQAEHALQKSRDELEERVDERTLELSALNEELTATNEELNSVNEELIATNEDLSLTLDQLQKTQRQLVESEKIAALGSIVVGVAHEINTPLGNGITTASFLSDTSNEALTKLEENSITRSFLDEYLHQMRDGADIVLQSFDKAARLVEKFKMVSIEGSEEVKAVFNVADYLSSLTGRRDALGQGGNKRFRLECDPSLEIVSYPFALARIVSHLIDNSLLHAFDEQTAGEINISVIKQEKELLMVYADDGKGMEPAVLAHVFDPFFTTRRHGQGGSGLGLSIVYNTVVKTFRGNIQCQSAPGKGTNFTIRLPLED
jgi:signal transduction histidine kinase